MKRAHLFWVLLILTACKTGREKELVDAHDNTHQPPALTQDSLLGTLIHPTNAFVVSSVPVTALEKRQEELEIDALGSIAYDTRYVNNISARVAGRIEKLYVRYRFQEVRKGQRIMDIYSPELMTAQQELLFLLKNDPMNTVMISAAKQKLENAGMHPRQINALNSTSKPSLTVAVYSPYNGHIHESGGSGMDPEPGTMRDLSLLTEELTLKEGMYLRQGQSIFTVFDPSRAWVLVNLFDEDQALVRVGNPVRVVPETMPGKDFRARVDMLEPFYRKESKTMTARVYFDNSQRHIPIGSQVRCTIFGNARNAQWLPQEAVLSLGMDRIVFMREGKGFRAVKVTTGIVHDGHVQIKQGLGVQDSVARNAQYLIDSESFIKVKSNP